MQLNISTGTITAWKKSHFILLEISDFYMVDNLSIAVYAFPISMLTLLSVDEILLARYMSWLVGWILWHINLCRLFNAKSIFIQIISSISNNSVQHEYTAQLSKTFLFQTIQFIQTVLIQLIQFSISTFVYTQLNVKAVLYITIQFSVSQFSISRFSMSKTVLFQTIHLSISTQFKFKQSLFVKNISTSSNSV